MGSGLIIDTLLNFKIKIFCQWELKKKNPDQEYGYHAAFTHELMKSQTLQLSFRIHLKKKKSSR